MTPSLSEIDLEIEPGETVGVIGPNGAGKSSLLRLVAGISSPTSGTVMVGGRVAAILELGLGFHPQMTGWDNLRTSAAILGMSSESLATELPNIAAFSELGRALDDPVRTYSAGMSARLGFAVAVHVPADVLVVDEVLAVGDRDFQLKCVDRIRCLTERGVTLLLVSHRMPLIAAICNRAVHLRHGRIVDSGATTPIVERYLSRSTRRLPKMASSPFRVVSATHEGPDIDPWEPIEIDMEVEVRQPVREPRIGLDLTLPTLDPDVIVATASTPVPELRAPGRYRLVGRTLPFSAEGGALRAHVSLVDHGLRQIADHAQLDFTVRSDRSRLRPYLSVRPSWSIRAAGRTDVDQPEIPVSPPSGRTLAALRNVSKEYRRRRDGSERPDPVQALRNVDVDVREGQIIGLIGPNGGGKSTLVRLLAGITAPDSGSRVVTGRAVPVFTFGLGFLPHLSGRENVYLSGRLLGLRRRDLDGLMPAMMRDLGAPEAIEQPVRTYSSGMRARLGFSLAVHTQPDVLLLDETLSVGDEQFRESAVERVRRLSQQGTAVVIVSHDLDLIEQVCESALLLDRGELVLGGATEAVLRSYGHRHVEGASFDRHTGVRVRRFEVDRSLVPRGGTLRFSGLMEVLDPLETPRVELSYRAPGDVGQGAAADVAERSTFVTSLDLPEGVLRSPGLFSFDGSIERNDFHGVVDVTIAVVDAQRDRLMSEAWRRVTFGSPDPGQPHPRLALEPVWTATRMPDLPTSD